MSVVNEIDVVKYNGSSYRVKHGTVFTVSGDTTVVAAVANKHIVTVSEHVTNTGGTAGPTLTWKSNDASGTQIGGAHEYVDTSGYVIAGPRVIRKTNKGEALFADTGGTSPVFQVDIWYIETDN